MNEEEIHNIYLHMSGKAEGLVEATGKADFPVLFARAILEYSKKQWVGLTDEDMKDPKTSNFDFIYGARWAEQILKERNK